MGKGVMQVGGSAVRVSEPGRAGEDAEPIQRARCGGFQEKDSAHCSLFLFAFFWIEYFYGSIWVFVYVSWLHFKCLIFPPGF